MKKYLKPFIIVSGPITLLVYVGTFVVSYAVGYTASSIYNRIVK